MNYQRDWDLIIVGAGAAGIFAAAHAHERNPNARILILERGPQPLRKVKISGGGRCNVTHACFEPTRLAENYPRGQRELLGPFHSWQPRDTIRWFEERKVRLKTESDGRVFPISDDSQTIIDALLRSIAGVGITLRLNTPVLDIRLGHSQGFELTTPGGCPPLRGSSLLIASGGLKPGAWTDCLRRLGHTIEPLAPSLFTFVVSNPLIDRLAGVSHPDVEISVPSTRIRQRGPLLITHRGLSGPAILKTSAWIARWAQGRQYRFPCLINWLPGTSDSEILDEFRKRREAASRRSIGNAACFGISSRLWSRLLESASIVPALPWSQVSRQQTNALVHQLTSTQLDVSGRNAFKEEFVTCGGIRLDEVNFKTMESRRARHLYFAGETLDIDALTGGFNFQAAWTTGALAGRAIVAN